MPSFRVPLVGSYTNRNANPAAFSLADQQFINCFPEVTQNPITGKASVTLNKRAGAANAGALTSVSAAGAAGAIAVWTGNSAATPPVVAPFLNTAGTSMSVWNLVNTTQVGADIPSVTECVGIVEVMINSTAHLLGNFIEGSSVEQWYFPEGGAWTQVTDSDFPTDLVGFPAHMDGYVFNMTAAGRIYNSDLNSVSSYQAASYVTSNGYPDKGVTVARYNNYILGFGEKSIEIFENAGNAFGSPLKRVSVLHMGAARRAAAQPQTVLVAHNTIYWIGTNSQGAADGIYKLKGMAPERISNQAIAKMLATRRLRGFCGTALLHGMNHVVLRGDDGVWCYCVETGFWWKWLLASGEVRACTSTSTVISPINGTTYFTGTNNATSNVIEELNATYQDNSAAYTMTARTDLLDFDTDRVKFFEKLRLSYDVQSTSSGLTVAASDDDFANYTTLGTIDMSQTTSWLTRLGSARRRSFRFTHSANTPCRIKALEIDYRVGSN